MKKRLFLFSLILVVVTSCGGGGGGGGSAPINTGGNATHNINNNLNTVQPSREKPVNPIISKGNSLDSNGNIKWNDKNFNYNNKNPMNNTNTKYTGENVRVGILDFGFSQINNYLDDFNNRPVVLRSQNTNIGVDEHGIKVLELLANKRTGIAKNIEAYIYESDRGDRDKYYDIITIGERRVEGYKNLDRFGIKIFNQSYGNFTEINKDNYKFKIGYSLINFYNKAVNDGALFIWSAGNDKTQKNSSNYSRLPNYEKGLEKGWLNVVGISVKPRENNEKVATYDSAGRWYRDWNTLEVITPAGDSANWTISAMFDYEVDIKGKKDFIGGTSVSAPYVTGVVALLKEKYPFMDGSLLRQTILSTATDIGAEGVDNVFGWGLLNVDKALNGPSKFTKQLALGDNVEANVNRGSYTFSNDISGDAGLNKRGQGELILSGKNTYTGDTTVYEGRLIKTGTTNSNIINRSNGVVLLSDNSKIKSIYNEGKLEVEGNSELENFVATKDSRIEANLDSKLNVLGNVELNGSNLVINPLSEGKMRYITSNGEKLNIINSENIIGNFGNVETSDLLNVSVNNNNDIQISRKNIKDVVNSNTNDESINNVANNLEETFEYIDNNVNNISIEMLSSASNIQNLNVNNLDTLESLSGEIYASSQTLTFEQAETINKDISNRLNHLKDSNKDTEIWASTLKSTGKISKKGYASGDTDIDGILVGFDQNITNNTTLGIASAFSKSKAIFDKNAGNTNGKSINVSFYGKHNFNSSPLYLQGRIGFGKTDSNIKRNIITGNDMNSENINHKDKILSTYLETGYNFNKDDLSVIPFVGLESDIIKRGAFKENSNFGLNTESKKYKQHSGLLGLKVNKKIDKLNLNGYVTYKRAFNNEDLSFNAKFKGIDNKEINIKGIGLNKNKIWTGFGASYEVNNRFSLYGNYDLKFEKNRTYNNVFSLGFGIKVD